LTCDALAPGHQSLSWSVTEEDGGARLDVFLARNTSRTYSRTYLQSLIRDGCVEVDGSAATLPSCRVETGQRVRLLVPPPKETTLQPEDIPLDVVYEDEDLLVINKHRGMVVHPAPGHYSGTLVHALLHHCPSLSSINNIMRPGIVHRLDKDTTGLLVVAKNNPAHLALAHKIKKHQVERTYLALVHGVPDVATGKIDAPVGRDPDTRFKMKVVRRGGKHAATWFCIKEILGPDHALLTCRLETGRTHQIRVHLAFIGHPVVGDPMYAEGLPGYGLEGQALHATRLRFEHPSTGDWMEFEAPMPEDMLEVLESLRSAAS